MPHSICCSPYIELEFPASTLETKKRRARVRSLPAEAQGSLQSKPLAELDRFIDQNSAFMMVPKSVVCPMNVISDVISRSKSIHCLQDMETFSGLRQQLQLPFFNVLQTVCPSHKHSRLSLPQL